MCVCKLFVCDLFCYCCSFYVECVVICECGFSLERQDRVCGCCVCDPKCELFPPYIVCVFSFSAVFFPDVVPYVLYVVVIYSGRRL